jgi:hypothetical protein
MSEVRLRIRLNRNICVSAIKLFERVTRLETGRAGRVCGSAGVDLECVFVGRVCLRLYYLAEDSLVHFLILLFSFGHPFFLQRSCRLFFRTLLVVLTFAHSVLPLSLGNEMG